MANTCSKSLLTFFLVLREVETFGIRYKRGSKDYENAMKESLKKFLPLAQRATNKVGYFAAIGSLIKQMLSIPLSAYSHAGRGEEKLYLMSWFTCMKLNCRNDIKFMYTVQWNPWEKIKTWPQFWSIYYKQVRQGEQGWRTGESTHLSPMLPGFRSQCWSHMWVEFVVGSLPCSERFFPGFSAFPPPQKPTLPNSNLIWNAQTTSS